MELYTDIDTTVKYKTSSDLFSGYQMPVIKSNRNEFGDLLDLFLIELNPSRIEAGYKPLKHAALAKKFKDSKLEGAEVYRFYKDCKKASSFSKFFWWSFKIQNK